MRLLVLDAETRDPNLKLYGQGCVFATHYPEYDFKVLLFAYMDHGGNVGATKNWQQLQELIDAHDAIIGHNLMYDIGCLLYLASQGHINFKIGDKILFDTMIMAKLFNQNFNSYALDYLGGVLVGQKKQSDLLHDFAWSTGLYAAEQKKITGRNCNTRPSDAVLEKWCKSHMDLFPEDVLSSYAVGDIILTRKLYDRLIDKVSYLDLTEFSEDLYITIDMKFRGVDIDLRQCEKVRTQFEEMAREAEEKVFAILESRIDLGKIQKQLAPLLEEKGYNVPRTDKDNYSITDDWLEEQTDNVFANIRTWRKALQKNRNFIGKIIDYQKAIPEKYQEKECCPTCSGLESHIDTVAIHCNHCDGNGEIKTRGKLFPSLKLLGAHVTGRFSSGGGQGSLEVSIHQIPVRDPIFSAPCRSIFIPYKGETWIAGDFNSQESRLQVHDACLLECEGAEVIRDKWIADPSMSYHTTTAEIIGIERSHAKTINLGLSYGMGKDKLINDLGVSRERGLAIIEQYHEMLPFMRQLQQKCSQALKVNRYIKTIGGRKLVKGKEQGSEKDGLSRRVQGSAADQCRAAMRAAYRAGLKMLIVVHDEINISSAAPENDEKVLKDCMENAMKLCVPVVADIGRGKNWLEAK